MTNHEEWFSNLEKSDLSGVVETKDDTPHPIKHIEDVPLSHVSQKGIMRNVFHMPTITKNLVFVGQFLDQGMQIQFTHHKCYIEEEGKIIAQGRHEGRMFIVETNDVGIAMFGKGKKVESDIDLWHKQFGNVNFPRLWEMQTKNIVFGLPKFSGRNGFGEDTPSSKLIKECWN